MMNRDRIIELAKDARCFKVLNREDYSLIGIESIELFANLIAADALRDAAVRFNTEAGVIPGGKDTLAAHYLNKWADEIEGEKK